MAEIQVRNLTKFFGKIIAVNDVTLTIKDREFIVLLGPSGCGKSTILNCIAGLEKPDMGSISKNGFDMVRIPSHKRNIAMVFQNYALYPHMSVYNNLAFPLKMMKLSADEIYERIHRAARILQLEFILDRKPLELSGGQRQRVALGRAIVREPEAFLMDEPLSNLDAALRNETRGELKKLHLRIKATFVYVTHDQSEAMSMAERIAVMKNGVLLQVDAPKMIYDKSVDRFVAGFIGSPPINFIKGRFVSKGKSLFFISDSFKIRISEAAVKRVSKKPISEIIMGIRPEHIKIQPSGSSSEGIPVEVHLVEPLGADTIIEVATQKERIKTKIMGNPGIQPGDRAEIGIKTDSVIFFDSASGKNLLTV